MLDALDLVDELRFVLRGPLGGHDAVVATGGGIFREANNRWHGRGRLVADYGARLTLSVNLDTHVAKSARKRDSPWHSRCSRAMSKAW